VPATIVAAVPGPSDFNGASAVIARLPNIGFAPSMLTEHGFEVFFVYVCVCIYLYVHDVQHMCVEICIEVNIYSSVYLHSIRRCI